jgi:hypothetical protein
MRRKLLLSGHILTNSGSPSQSLRVQTSIVHDAAFAARQTRTMQSQDFVSWLFSGWWTLMRTALLGVLAYVAILLLLRFSGKRTLSKMNAFDLIVTIALGSILGSILTSRQIALAQGVVAFTVLIGLQYIVAWGTSRSRLIGRIVKAEPALLA